MSNIILVLYAVVSSAALVLLKLGGQAGAPVSIVNNRIEFNLGVYALSGIILYGLSFILYAYLISKNDLGYIVPLSTALVYVFIFIASYIIFKEVFTPLKIIGILLILGGLILLNTNSK